MKTHQTHKLISTGIEALPPALHHDGNNLYLQVTVNKITGIKRRSWIYRYRTNGRSHDMGLGGYPRISLSGARRLAEQVAITLALGHDPIKQRNAQRALKRDASEATRLTLKRTITTYLAAKKSKWSKAQKDKWEDPLRLHVYPKFGAKPVTEIDEKTIRSILEPLWSTKEATAKKIRSRLASVLAWAMYMNYLPRGPNPAEWKDALDTHFQETTKVNNRAAMPYAQVPAFMKELRTKGGVTSSALQFLILTATRTKETLEATWSEIDLTNKVWTIPASRMKTGKEHKVPLPETALAILSEMQTIKVSDYIFPGTLNNQPLDQTIFRYLKGQMGHKGITIHGFRSAFKDWAADETDYPNEVSEMALAHAVPNAVEAAYRRGALLKKRISLMNDWADFINKV